MKYGLLVSGITEILGALLVFFIPQLVLNEGAVLFSLARIYSVLVFVMGMVNIFAYIHYEESPLARKIFMLMFFFHGAVALMSNAIHESVFKQSPTGTVIHLAIFILFVILYLIDVKPKK